MNENENKVHKLVDLEEDIARLEAKIAAYRQQAGDLRLEVDGMVRDVADRFLTDEAGNPVDGAVYWYRGQAIVRVGTLTRIIPVQTMDGEKLFGSPEAEAEAEAALVMVTV